MFDLVTFTKVISSVKLQYLGLESLLWQKIVIFIFHELICFKRTITFLQVFLKHSKTFHNFQEVQKLRIKTGN